MAMMAMTPTLPDARRPRRIPVAALAALFMASAVPASAWASGDVTGIEVESRARVEAPTEVRATRPRQPSAPGSFSMNLYSRGDFVNQQTTYWCIPASTQTMMNIMDAGSPTGPGCSRHASIEWVTVSRRTAPSATSVSSTDSAGWASRSGPACSTAIELRAVRAGRGQVSPERAPEGRAHDAQDRQAGRTRRLAWGARMGDVGLHGHGGPALTREFTVTSVVGA